LSSKSVGLSLKKRRKLSSGDMKRKTSSCSKWVRTASLVEAFDRGCSRGAIMAAERTLELRCRYWNRIEAVRIFRIVVAAKY
jgi:hypothetical protein